MDMGAQSSKADIQWLKPQLAYTLVVFFFSPNQLLHFL